MNPRRNLLIPVLLVFGATLVAPGAIYSQRISPDDQPSKQEQSTDDKKREELILPENVEKDQADEKSREMFNKAKIQKLKADSAAMRVEFEEAISQLKSDSAAMRRRFERRIQSLKQQIKDLKNKLEKGKNTSEDTSDQKEMVLPEEVEETSRPDDSEQKTSASEGDLFNPNTASVSELSSIPGLSKRLAERIEWYRREVRPFNSRDDLRRVPGVDRETYQKIHSYFHEGSY